MEQYGIKLSFHGFGEVHRPDESCLDQVFHNYCKKQKTQQTLVSNTAYKTLLKML